ncbi:MAG: hypothetical protein U0R49_04735 [Fimbriimonadales bacterium]
MFCAIDIATAADLLVALGTILLAAFTLKLANTTSHLLKQDRNAERVRLTLQIADQWPEVDPTEWDILRTSEKGKEQAFKLFDENKPLQPAADFARAWLVRTAVLLEARALDRVLLIETLREPISVCRDRIFTNKWLDERNDILQKHRNRICKELMDAVPELNHANTAPKYAEWVKKWTTME